jgi:hypothetical protein
VRDKQGRRYARLAEIKAGSYIRVDGDFDCMKKNSLRKVFRDREGYYVVCSRGRHHLDGQSDGHGNLIGMYQEETENV